MVPQSHPIRAFSARLFTHKNRKEKLEKRDKVCEMAIHKKKKEKHAPNPQKQQQ